MIVRNAALVVCNLTIVRALLLLVLCLLAGSASAQDKLVGANVDVRTILNFKVSAAAIQRLLPPGWGLNPPASGPSEGANLQITFVDQLASGDLAGRQTTPVRYVIFAFPGRKLDSETSGLMIFAGLSGGGPGPYGTNIKATNIVERKVRHESTATTVEESWEYNAEDGSSVSLQVQYVRGIASRNRSEMRVYSQVRPAFSRIYRYEQGVDMVRGAGTDRLQRFVFKARGERFSPLFDGTEQLISLTAIPWYAREIYLPGS